MFEDNVVIDVRIYVQVSGIYWNIFHKILKMLYCHYYHDYSERWKLIQRYRLWQQQKISKIKQ